MLTQHVQHVQCPNIINSPVTDKNGIMGDSPNTTIIAGMHLNRCHYCYLIYFVSQQKGSLTKVVHNPNGKRRVKCKMSVYQEHHLL